MNNIELGNIDSIINDDSALSVLVNGFIKGADGDFVFVLPEGTSIEVRNTFEGFINKVNFGFSAVGRATRILPTIIKSPPVVVPAPVAEPEVIAEPVPVVEITKRKK